MPVATAMAEPPLEPPGMRVGSWGLRLWGVVTPSANSWVVALPSTTAPARPQARHPGRVDGGELVVGRRPAPGGHAGDVDDVLDRHRDAVERPEPAARRALPRRGRRPRPARRSGSRSHDAAEVGVGRRRPRAPPRVRPTDDDDARLLRRQRRRADRGRGRAPRPGPERRRRPARRRAPPRRRRPAAAAGRGLGRAEERVGVARTPPPRELPAGRHSASSAVEQRRRRGDRAEHAALHRHHLQRGQVVAVVGGAGAVLEQQALVAAVVGVAHRGVHADVGGDAGEDEVGDARACAGSGRGRSRRTRPCPACR